MAALEFKAARISSVTAQGVKHLPAEFGEHGGVVFAIDEKRFAVGAHPTLDIGDRTDGSPIISKFVHGDMVAQAFPDVVCGHPLTDDIGIISGKVEKTASLDGCIVHQRDVAHGGT